MRQAIRRACSVVALMLLCSCNSTDTVEEPEPTGPVELVEIEHPDISNLDEGVRQRLVDVRGDLESKLGSEASAADKADAYGRMGMHYHAYTFLGAAETCYRNAAALDPEDHRWPYYAGRIQRNRGGYEEAQVSFEHALRLQPDDLAVLVQLGEVEAQLGSRDRAGERFRRALELDPACAPALAGLGTLAASNRDFDEAVSRFEAALRVAPEATALNYPLGLAYRELGNDDRARELIEQRGSIAPTLADPMMYEVDRLAQSWRIHLSRGSLLIRREQYDLALSELGKAAEAAPDEPVVHLNMGAALARVGRLAEAMDSFETAAKLDPSNATTFFNLGTLRSRLGDDDAAVKHYRAALQADPGMTDVHFNLANALRRLGRSAESIEHYRKIVERDQGNEPARLGEVFALVREGRRREALGRLEAGIEAIPESERLRDALARLLAAAPEDTLRDGGRALEIAEQLMTEHRSLTHAITLAMAAAETGDFTLAIQWQETAIENVQRMSDARRLAKLQADLALYRQGRPCRTPWRPDDPLLLPSSQPATRSTTAASR